MKILSCLFIIILGTLGHFFFEWSGHKKAAGIFFAVNESTWEHIKLAIYPSFLWMIVDGLSLGFTKGLVIAEAAAMITSIIAIPALFYGYTAITRKNWLFPDILCFVFSIIAGREIFYLAFRLNSNSSLLFAIAAVALAAIAVAYLSWSYNPPKCFLFRDPISGEYGPHGHGCHTHYHKR